MNNLFRIVPKPKLFDLKVGYFNLPKCVNISFKNASLLTDTYKLFKHLRNIFTDFKVVEDKSIISFIKIDLEDEAYEIVVDTDHIDIFASSTIGWFYALQSLKQIIVDGRIPCSVIKDKPNLKLRGVMLDISRSKVPKVETLKSLFDLFATLKYNHVELYVEGFSFEYKSFPNVLNDKNYLTLEEYLELQEYAVENFLDFVPNQNGFGHMADWLDRPEYHKLAECEEGFTIWGAFRKPSTLNPQDEQSIKHVSKMYDDMLPHTKSKYFNMNFDEPYELGHGKSKEVASQTSIEDVYIDYLHKLVKEVRKYDKTPMIWADVVIKHPEAVKKINDDIILIDWGYTKIYPFESHAKMLSECNRKFILAGGTSTWGVITCRYDDMYQSINNSAINAYKYGGLGIIVTDWGDIGHLQYLPNSYMGFIHGAICAWSGENEEDMKYMLEKIVGKDVSEVLLKLSRYTELEGEYRDYGSRLFYHILWSEHSNQYEDRMKFFDEKIKSSFLSDESINKLNNLINEVEIKLSNLESKNLEVEELLNSTKLLKTLLVINKKLQDASNNFEKEIKELEDFEANHLVLWNARNKEAGLKFSINRIIWLKQILIQKTTKGDNNE